jgi:hypothetical protein
MRRIACLFGVAATIVRPVQFGPNQMICMEIWQSAEQSIIDFSQILFC